MAPTVFALVDYDNQKALGFGSRGRPTRPPNERDHQLNLESLTVSLADYASSLGLGFAELRVRLYGGWTESLAGTRTDAAMMISSAIRNVGRHRYRDTRVLVELADAPLVAEDSPLYHTSRNLPWNGRGIKASSLPTCMAAGSLCGNVEVLLSWAKGRCPEPTCSVATKDLFVIRTQKMVDTMLATDLLACVTARSPAAVAVVSMDDDMVPGLVSAAVLAPQTRITLLRHGKRRPGNYDDLIQSHGIELRDLPMLGGEG